ncbi:hypothetical protein SHJG_6526 [Streptomyces hygroscopicus subsp. jinggangensis 5008]|nr:hypothetical protein SHJG_6526 [Streptomyces hygroscopicus subsp. jinggangensis 5008]AGF65949.1 hypothetical protein SHJGH_6286 [Streptomyces hygroscopicus subsp. jinggangensis TL01]
MTRVEGAHRSSFSWGSPGSVGLLAGVCGVVKLLCCCGGWRESDIKDAYMSGP